MRALLSSVRAERMQQSSAPQLAAYAKTITERSNELQSGKTNGDVGHMTIGAICTVNASTASNFGLDDR